MARVGTIALGRGVGYDGCLVANYIKKLLSCPPKAEPVKDYTITSNLEDIKTEIIALNKDGKLDMSYAYLKIMEQTLPKTGFRYTILYKDNNPVLFGYFQLFTLTSHNFSLQKNTGFAKGILKFFLDWKKIKVLVSGNVLRNNTNCCCFNPHELDNLGATELLASVGEKIAADEGATAFILKDLQNTKEIADWLGANGYYTPWQDNVMNLEIDPKWGSLNGYIASLTRKYKTRANKIKAAGSVLETKILTEIEVETFAPKISVLFANVLDSQEFLLTRPIGAHLGLLKSVYKDNFEVVGLFLEGEMVAFYTAFVCNEAYEIYYVGFGYEQNTTYQFYFNILFSGLERCILLQKKQLQLGRTSFDAKASLGAKPQVMPYFVKTPNVPNVACMWFANYFSSLEDGKWKLRNPLKHEGKMD